MNLRIRIAKWLAPELGRPIDNYKDEAEYWSHRSDMWSERAMKRGIILNNIIALETPKCASIGKRMAAIAREAVK